MKFKKLRLHGFKSFAEPSELLFQDGVTGVVGPNGCGKSNLLEALRWVMGESRAKTVRGEGMEDVIFAGSDRRPARAFAEVSLLLDNSDRKAPEAFNATDEIEISRKITRDSGSVYRVNGKEARARDLQLIFADAGTGAASPALVRQGQISDLIHAKPKQRRKILEDAAGIGGLYSRRHEAELRLEAAERNLEKLTDLFRTAESRMRVLKKQAEKAAKYRDLTTKIRKFEAERIHILYKRAEIEREAAEIAAHQAKEQANIAEREVIAAFTEEEKNRQKIVPLKEEAAIAAAVLRKAELDAAQNENALNEARARLGRLEKALESAVKDKAREADMLADAETALHRLEQETAEFSQSAGSEEENEAEYAERSQITRNALTAAEKQADETDEKIRDITARQREAARRMSEAKERYHRLEKEFLTLTDSEAGLQKELTEKLKSADSAENVGALELKSEEIRENLVTAEKAFEAAKNAVTAAQRGLQEKEIARKTLIAEKNGLQALTAKTGVNKRAAQILERVTAKAGYEKALGAALGEALEYDTDITASRYWVTAPSAKGGALPAHLTALSDYVTAPDYLTAALSYIMVGEEAVLQDSETYLPPGGALVTKDGKTRRFDGFVSKGGDQNKAAVLLEQKNRLTFLETEEKRLLSEIEAAQAAYQKAAKTAEQAQAAFYALKTALAENEKRLTLARNAENQLKNECFTLETKLKALSDKKNDLATETEKARDTVRRAAEETEISDDLEKLQTESAVFKQDVKEKRNQLTEIYALAESAKRARQEKTKRREALQKDLTDWQRRRDSARARQSEIEEREKKLTRDLSEARLAPETLRLAYENGSKNKVLATERAEKNRTALDAGENELALSARQHSEAQKSSARAHEEKARTEALLLAAVEKFHNVKARLEEMSQTNTLISTEAAKRSGESERDIHDLEENLREFSREQEALGAVNLLAESELTETETEIGKLITEKEDLSGAIEKLRTVIRELNEEGREKILNAFEKVNAQFQDLFQRLFVGGEASLELIESDDPLEAGLEISAMPPGKKTKSLALLSGGEQALTCTALIFAIFLTNPSPVCVLDEVDAPLDDANTERFCHLIAEMTRLTDTRFLVITHRALTMARSNRLFGVTMAEKGVSQLVCVDLVAAEKLVAA